MSHIIIAVFLFSLGLVCGMQYQDDVAARQIKAAYYDGRFSCMNAQKLGKAVIENEYREDTL